MLKLPRLRARVGKRGGCRYYFDVDPSAKPRRWKPLHGTEAQIERQYRDLIAQPKPERGTVDQMLAECIAAMDGKVAPGTLANYRSFRKHLSAVFRWPEDVTQADVVKYLRLCPRKSFRGEVALLSTAYVRWMDEGRLAFNPCFGVRIRRPGSRRTRLLSPTELAAIIEHADERTQVWIELAYATGLRISDCCRLKWADLAGIFTAQKTGTSHAIEAGDALTPILDRARALQARVASRFVLCDRRGQAWKPDTLRTHWHDACEAAGVADTRPHDLRAAAATAIEKAHGVAAAQEFLGHRDLRTTLVYLRERRARVIRPLRRVG